MTATLLTFPVFRAFDSNGAPLAGGLLYSYQAGTTTPLATYVDQAGVTQNTNPVVLDSTGTANVWLGDSTYKLVLKDSDGVQQWSVDNIQSEQAVVNGVYTNLANTSDISKGDALVGVKQPYTGASARTQHQKNQDFVSILDFGADPTGTTNSAPMIQAAFNACKNVYIPEGTYYIETEVSPQGNSVIWGAGRNSHIQIIDGDTNGINIDSVSGVTVKGLKISCKNSTGTLGGLSGKAAIYLSNAAQCTIEDNFIFNIYNCGIRLYDSSNNKISNNSFGDWFLTSTANSDASNIYLMGACSYNVIDSNFCVGANAGSGVAVSDYYLSGKQPIGNIITDNRVDNKQVYGILFYTTLTGSPSGFDCQTIISNNVISNVSGSGLKYAGQNGAGAGIYLQGGGGAVCSGNAVYNCCIDTENFGTNLMAHITASIADQPQTAPILITNNQIHSIKGPGIWGGSSTEHGIHIKNNVIRCDQTTSGFDTGIILSNCTDSSVTGNSVYHSGPGSAIYINAVSGTFSQINVSDNTIKSTNASGTGLQFDRTTSGGFTNVICSNNTINAVYNGVSVNWINYGVMNGNRVSVGNIALYDSNNTYLARSGNSFKSTLSGYAIILNDGVGNTWDKNNFFSAKMQHNNDATGTVEMYTDSGSSTVPPVYGTYQLGDRVVNRAGVVGQPKAWRCTTAGEPGTWTSEGNL